MGSTVALGQLAVDSAASFDPVTGLAIIKTGGGSVFGGRAAVSAWPAPAADGGSPTVMLDKFGRLMVAPVPDDLELQSQLTLTTGNVTQLFAAGGAGVMNKLLGFLASNTSGTGVRLDFLDGATLGPSVFLAAAGGGATPYTSLPWKGTAATAMNVQLSAGVTDVRLFAVGYRTV